MSTPDWIVVLRLACTERSQKTIARDIGYSATVVNQVLKGIYPGDMGAVEQAVKGALMDSIVACPVLGEMRMDACLQQQRSKFSPINHTQVQLFRSCQGCPNNRKNQAAA